MHSLLYCKGAAKIKGFMRETERDVFLEKPDLAQGEPSCMINLQVTNFWNLSSDPMDRYAQFCSSSLCV